MRIDDDDDDEHDTAALSPWLGCMRKLRNYRGYS